MQIKTLRLATSYIHYLTRVLEGEDTPGGFRAELVPSSRKINAERRANMHKNGLTDNLQVRGKATPNVIGWVGIGVDEEGVLCHCCGANMAERFFSIFWFICQE